MPITTRRDLIVSGICAALFVLFCSTAVTPLSAAPSNSMLGANETEFSAEESTFDAEVEYIQTDGNSWVDTGITISPQTTVSVVAAYTTVRSGQLFGSGYVGSNRFNFGTGSGVFQFGFGTGWFSVGSSDTKVHEFVLAANGNSCIGAVDGNEVAFTANSFVPYAGSFLIGARNGQTNKERATIKIYQCQIWQEGILVLDLIPVRVDVDGTPVGAMYDLVSGTLFHNSGTGSFILGPDL